jgi:glycosyltransferase involved in cell wall biosynthesis
MSRKSTTVVIAQRQIPHYRVPFLTKLRVLLANDGIELRLLTGDYYEDHLIPGELQGAQVLPTRHVGPFLWNGFTRHCRDADLVIIPQQIKQLDLFLLWLRRRFRSKPLLALWGHGKNFQAGKQGGAKELFKRFISKRVDWWFAYNDLSARVVSDLGFPSNRITSVGNAIDSKKLGLIREKLDQDNIAQVRGELNLKSENVGIYSGGLYAEKRIGFLLAAADRIRAGIPDFELIVIGDGSDRGLVEVAARDRSWIHLIGRRSGDEVIPHWALSKVLLMPGLVGLVIVDSFALGVPIVTTDYPYHSPEIDYLRNGINGMCVECGDSPDIYADTVIDLLHKPDELMRLRLAALASASEHTIEAMAANFAEGIKAALTNQRLTQP